MALPAAVEGFNHHGVTLTVRRRLFFKSINMGDLGDGRPALLHVGEGRARRRGVTQQRTLLYQYSRFPRPPRSGRLGSDTGGQSGGYVVF